MSREDAAARLGTTVRTIDRWLAKGLLHGRDADRAADGRRTTVVTVREVEAWRAKKEETAVEKSRVRALLPAPAAAQAHSGPLKPWVTVEQAAEYSGLPAAYLRRLIDAGELPARNVLEGTQASGVGWRIKLTELDRLPGVVPSAAEHVLREEL